MNGLVETKTILTMDASTLAKRIKNREIRSVDAGITYIHHLKTFNKKIYCVVAERFAEALEEAKAYDKLLDLGKADGALFGVPISVKESFDVKGMHTTGGFKHRAGFVATKDSDVVKRLKREGAIIICKTNTSTADLTFESHNKLFGRTNNPWEVTATAGGSSGGEAALIACGGAAVGVGSDLAGSLRMPAHFNGVLSFKAGAGDVSLAGHFPRPVHSLQEDMLGIGALSKSVADLALVHSILSNKDSAELELSDFRLIIPEIPRAYPMEKETKGALQLVRQFFIRNAKVDQPSMPGFIAKLPLLHLKVLAIYGAMPLYPAIFERERFPIARTMLREWTRKDTPYYDYFLKTLVLAKAGSTIFRVKSDKLDKLEANVSRLIASINSLLDQAVMILPVYPTPAKKHGELDKELLSNRFLYPKLMPYTILANALGLPALSIPIARSENGLPISIQLITRKGNEQALFHFGRQLEQEFLGYQRAQP